MSFHKAVLVKMYTIRVASNIVSTLKKRSSKRKAIDLNRPVTGKVDPSHQNSSLIKLFWGRVEMFMSQLNLTQPVLAHRVES